MGLWFVLMVYPIFPVEGLKCILEYWFHTKTGTDPRKMYYNYVSKDYS